MSKKSELRCVDALGDVPQQSLEVAPEAHPALDQAQFAADRIGDLLAGADDRLADRQARSARARTIKSMASGNSAMNAATRRLPIRLTTRYGKAIPRNRPTNAAGIIPIEVSPIRATVAAAATPIIVSEYCPMVIARPVRARRAATISRRGSQRRATRSMFGVVLCTRASDCVEGRHRAAAQLSVIVNRFEASPVAPPRHPANDQYERGKGQ